MTYFVSHRYDDPKDLEHAKETVYELQKDDWDNCYICPVLTVDACWEDLLTLRRNRNKIAEVHLDILCLCDALVVASEITQTMQKEIDFAKQSGMECYFL